MVKKIEALPILETNRLVLRRIEKHDAESILTYLSDEDVMEHYGLGTFQNVEDALDEISWYDSILKNNTGMRWGITLKEENKVIGSCGFLEMVAQHYRSDIGYELSKEYWGKGIASEALAAVINYGFMEMKLQRIQALIEPPNIRSQKLVEKHGFVKEGLLRKYEYTCGKFDDLYIFSLLKEDFFREV